MKLLSQLEIEQAEQGGAMSRYVAVFTLPYFVLSNFCWALRIYLIVRIFMSEG